ncbi:MAG: hypothetical protein ABH884_04045 [Candidatus Komeilibacteria bacterium]
MDFNKHSIRLVQQCPVCDRKYHEERVQIIDEQGNSFLAYMTCTFCQSNIIVRVISMPQGLVGSAILTDLTPEEVLKFSHEENIKANDILSVHEINKKGNIIEVINNLN